MEQLELHSRHLINVQEPINLKTNRFKMHRFYKKKTTSYRTGNDSKLMKYIAPPDCHRWSWVLSPSGRTQSGARHRRCSQRPPPEKERRHRKVPAHNSTSQSITRCHPILMLSALQSENGELRHRKRIQTAKRRLRHTSEGIS